MPLSRLCSPLLFLLALPSLAQTSTHEEEVVRNTYAQVTLLSSLGVVTSAALETHPDGTKDDPATVQKKLTNQVPLFILTDFKVGPISEITQDKIIKWTTGPTGSGIQVLDIMPSNTAFNVNSYQTSWTVYRAKWATLPDWQNELNQKAGDALTIADILHLAPQANWRGFIKASPPTFLRYAAYTVTATLEGKSSGAWKAIFFFGVDANGTPMIIPDDLLAASILTQSVLSPEDPKGLLLSPVRDNPVMRDWITQNIMPAESCSATSTRHYCCSKDRCGLSPVDFNQNLATSVPKAVMP